MTAIQNNTWVTLKDGPGTPLLLTEDGKTCPFLIGGHISFMMHRQNRSICFVLVDGRAVKIYPDEHYELCAKKECTCDLHVQGQRNVGKYPTQFMDTTGQRF